MDSKTLRIQPRSRKVKVKNLDVARELDDGDVVRVAVVLDVLLGEGDRLDRDALRESHLQNVCILIWIIILL